MEADVSFVRLQGQLGQVVNGQRTHQTMDGQTCEHDGGCVRTLFELGRIGFQNAALDAGHQPALPPYGFGLAEEDVGLQVAAVVVVECAFGGVKLGQCIF